MICGKCIQCTHNNLFINEGALVRPFHTAAVSLRRANDDSEGSGGGEPWPDLDEDLHSLGDWVPRPLFNSEARNTSTADAVGDLRQVIDG